MRRDDRWLWVGLGVLVLVLLAGPMLGGGMGMLGGREMTGWYGAVGPANGWLWGLGMGIGWLVLLALWVAVIGLVVLAVRRMTGNAEGESPVDTLQCRYARG